MNYSNLNTAAEILNVFRTCKNAGEKIELFECLATRSNPPLSALVEILERIQLEDVLALTIQAFQKVEDADVKEKLQQSEHLLQLLSEKAKSGASDLIRWAAAGAIETIGFDFIMVSQYLNEEPNKIAENIVKSNYNRFTDRNLLGSNNYDEFVRFWTYGPTYQLRKLTSHIRLDVNSYGVDISSQAHFYHFYEETKGLYIDNINEIVKNQEIYGIKQTNIYLKKAEEQDYPNDSVKQIYENELFEAVCQNLSSELLKDSQNYEYIDILIKNQIHSLQSNYIETRKKAAETILRLDKRLLEELYGEPDKLHLLSLGIIAANRDKDRKTYSYNELDFLTRQIQESQIIEQLVSRIAVIQYFRDWRWYLEEQKRKVEEQKRQLEEEKRKRNQIKLYIDNALPELEKIDSEFANKLVQIDFDQDPKILITTITEEFNIVISSLMSDIATLESEKYNRIFNSEKSNTSAKYLSISEIDGCGCVVAIIGLAIVIAYWQYIIMVLMVLVIIYCFALLLNENERERKIKKLKSDIVEKRNCVNILENHKQNLISIK